MTCCWKYQVMRWSRIIWISSIGQYLFEGTRIDWSSIDLALPPSNHKNHMVVIHSFLAVSMTCRMFLEFPLPVMMTRISHCSHNTFNCSEKIYSNHSSFPQAVMTGILSLKAIVLNLKKSFFVCGCFPKVVFWRSEAMWLAVAALQPFQVTNIFLPFRKAFSSVSKTAVISSRLRRSIVFLSSSIYHCEKTIFCSADNPR